MAVNLIDLGKEIQYIDIDAAKVPYTFNIKLGGTTYTFTIKYNGQGGFFTADLAITNTGESGFGSRILIYGDPVRYGRPMFGSIEDERFPEPVIIPLCMTGDMQFGGAEFSGEVTFANFGKEVKLYLFDRRVV